MSAGGSVCPRCGGLLDVLPLLDADLRPTGGSRRICGTCGWLGERGLQ